MRHLVNAHCMTGTAGDITGWLFLPFGGAGRADQYSNSPLGRMY